MNNKITSEQAQQMADVMKEMVTFFGNYKRDIKAKKAKRGKKEKVYSGEQLHAAARGHFNVNIFDGVEQKND